MMRVVAVGLVASFLVLAGPAAAFDCARATTPVEKAICASPQARETDDRMAAAYGEARALLPPEAARALREGQRLWIKYREDTCGWAEEPERTGCTVRETEKRWRLLAGRPVAGPGTGGSRLVPHLVARAGDKRRYALDVSALVFAAPQTAGEHAFNDAVKALHADAPVDETIDFDSPGELSYHLGVDVLYASPDFVSALATGWRYDGGAHGNSWTRAVNVDLKAGRLLSFADLFPDAAREVFARLCNDQLLAAKRERLEVAEAEARSDLESYRATIDEHIADLARWSFGKDRAEVTFDPYAVGSYVEGEYTCRFDYGAIGLYASPDVKLPR